MTSGVDDGPHPWQLPPRGAPGNSVPHSTCGREASLKAKEVPPWLWAQAHVAGVR